MNDLLNVSARRGIFLLLSACLAMPAAAAPAPPERVSIESNLPVAAVMACFRVSGHFATFAHYAQDVGNGTATYRLRFDRSLLEEVHFRARAGGGSRIDVTLSPDYSRSDRAMFRTARGDALVRCARAPVDLAGNGGGVSAQ